MTNRQLLANALRVLAIDATEQAQSGHPGMPMGMADIAQVLWGDFLRHNPRNPHWLNRDRFVLSNGHGSMLLYALLHLTGYALSLEDLRHFRQLHSKTPGHPEYHVTPGVETTTGPLGQGLANAVGMALAERSLAQAFNRPSHTVIDHHTYVFLGDGCLMEGISHEACSLAGTLGLGKLIACWDDNGISIDGPTSGWFSEDVAQRFTAYGWQVLTVDGHDAEAIRHAFIAAQAETARPSLLCCKTVIGYGAPQAAGSAKVHGAPLGAAESRAAKQALGWDLAPFSIPAAVASAWDACSVGAAREQAWQTQFNAYRDAYPALADELLRRMQGQLPAEWNAQIEQLVQDTYAKQETVATRKASLHCLQALLPVLPELLGGSADLSESNCTFAPGHTALSREQAGNYVHYGVREFAMAAIMNGLALHGGFIPYGGTFLTFVDYARNAVRMAALMQQRVIFVLTHDSIGLGEDGPTHQPVEHIAMLRVTPNVTVWRPCDSVETAVAWRHAVENQRGPTCLLLSRQALPYQARSAMTLAQVSRGGYILRDSAAVQLIIMATGSEVALACAAAERLTLQGYGVRVVSMPSVEVFAQQDAAYRAAVLPAAITKRMAVEAGVSDIWYKYVGLNGCVVGLDRFGESAPAPQVFAYLGFSVENIVAQALVLLAD